MGRIGGLGFFLVIGGAVGVLKVHMDCVARDHHQRKQTVCHACFRHE